jgi:hypothetical protein
MATLDRRADALRVRPVLRRTALRRARPREVVLVRRTAAAGAHEGVTRAHLLAPFAAMTFAACLLNALSTADARDPILVPLLGLCAVAVMLLAGWRAAGIITALLRER